MRPCAEADSTAAVDALPLCGTLPTEETCALHLLDSGMPDSAGAYPLHQATIFPPPDRPLKHHIPDGVMENTWKTITLVRTMVCKAHAVTKVQGLTAHRGSLPTQNMGQKS